MLFLWFLLYSIALCSATQQEPEEPPFPLGFLSYVTSTSQSLIAATVAFDLDFRKNFDEELRARLGPPVIQIPALDPRLRILPYVGTTHGEAPVGMRTAVDWMQGASNFSSVVGIVGSVLSSVAIPVSTTASAFEVPMVSFASIAAPLSDKADHPFFLRTVSPDIIQGAAQWAWLLHFDIPSVAYLYTQDEYGTGLLRAFADRAMASQASYRVNPIVMRLDPTSSEPENRGQDARVALEAVGTRFCILVATAAQASALLLFMKQVGQLETYQWLGSEGSYQPGGDYPVGFQSFHQHPRSAKFQQFQELWSKLTEEDVYGEGARERYMLDHMQVKLSEALVPPVTAETFAVVDDIPDAVAYLFDTGYVFAFAINSLLAQGVEPHEIRGAKLLQELERVRFEGVTGELSFNAQGDRIAPFGFFNIQEVNAARTHIGDYDTLSGMLTLLNGRLPVWTDGSISPQPPEWLCDCLTGFEKDRTHMVCVPCRIGSGCGFDDNTGFPLGIFGPFTSVSQTYLAAAVAFDLDFKKNYDPVLRARFGPPIINLSNLDPRLRVKVQLGTSNSTPSTAVKIALDWLEGNGGFHRVVGMIGGFHSSTSTPVSSLALAFQVPMVSWAASSAALSDEIQHPYFTRTVASDTLQGTAMWTWALTFQVPAIALVYTREQYGEGLFGIVNDITVAYGVSSRINGIAILHQPTEPFDAEIGRGTVEYIRVSGSRFVMLVMGAMEANYIMYFMEQEGMLYSGYQIFGCDTIMHLDHAVYHPSYGLPVGFQQFLPVSRGPLYPSFEEMWKLLTTDDVYGSEAVQGYMLDQMQVLLSDAIAPAVSAANFSQPEGSVDVWIPFLFDACYTFVIAINSMLLAGYDPTEIYGQSLLEEVRRTSFEGISGSVQFTAIGDRLVELALWNVQRRAAGSTGHNFEGIVVGNASLQALELGRFNSAENILSINTGVPVVWVGDIRNDAVVPMELLYCLPNFEWHGPSGSCDQCPFGRYSRGVINGVWDYCKACSAGTSVHQSGTANQTCQPCPAGSFRGDEMFVRNCSSCAVGTYAASAGQSACDLCPVGKFAGVAGLSECVSCGGALWTTMSKVEVNGVQTYAYSEGASNMSQCGCDEGARLASNGSCVACGEGLLCRGLDDVTIIEGFYAAEDLSVYRCYGKEERCVGGIPGRTCAFGRRGLACAECVEGMRPGSQGTCQGCEDGDAAYILVAVSFIFCILVFTHWTVERHTRTARSHAFVLMAIAGGQLILVTQTVGVVSLMALALDEPFSGLAETLGRLAFNLEWLRINCAVASDPLAEYGTSIAIIFLAILALLVIHIIAVLIPVFQQYPFSAKYSTLFGSVGIIFMVFHISVTSTVLEPLQCLQHPNTKWTMRAYPSVVCYETEEHARMFLLGIATFLTVPLAISVAVTCIVLLYPSRMRAGDVHFLKSFSFLFYRYKPQKYWFVMVQYTRGMLIAMILVIPEAPVQVLLLQVIVLVALLITFQAKPWRGRHSNVLDCCLGVALLILLCVAGLFVRDKDKNPHLMAVVGASLLAVIILSVATAEVWGIYWRFGPREKPYQFFLCHHKAGSGAFARLLKMGLIDSRRLKGDVFIDSDNLESLDELFAYVCCDTGNLVVLASVAVFTRPWCVGEMCTARLERVQTVVVPMPDFDPPNDEFINDLKERISDWEVLTENGLEFPMIVETMRWVVRLPRFDAPKHLSLLALDHFSRCLIAGYEASQASFRCDESTCSSEGDMAHALIVYDLGNLEAAASSLVLLKLLTVHLANRSHDIPNVLSDEHLPLSTERCIVMCTEGCLYRHAPIQLLLQLHGIITQVQLLPVLAEANFHVPSSEQMKGWQQEPPMVGMPPQDAWALSVLVQKLFTGIAPSFQPNHASENVLDVGAKRIVKFLQNSAPQSIWNIVSLTGGTTPSGRMHSTKTLSLVPAMTSEDMDDDEEIDDWTEVNL